MRDCIGRSCRPPRRWPGDGVDATFEGGPGTLTFDGAGGGLPFVAQHASVPGTVPVILAGWLAQNKLVRGLSFGAIK